MAVLGVSCRYHKMSMTDTLKYHLLYCLER